MTACVPIAHIISKGLLLFKNPSNLIVHGDSQQLEHTLRCITSSDSNLFDRNHFLKAGVMQFLVTATCLHDFNVGLIRVSPFCIQTSICFGVKFRTGDPQVGPYLESG